jgi:hypothetical protein
MTDHSRIIEGLMGLETDYRDRTIDDHIDQFEDIGIL